MDKEIELTEKHDPYCTWESYKEKPPGKSSWGELSYQWSMKFCSICKNKYDLIRWDK